MSETAGSWVIDVFKKELKDNLNNLKYQYLLTEDTLLKKKIADEYAETLRATVGFDILLGLIEWKGKVEVLEDIQDYIAHNGLNCMEIIELFETEGRDYLCENHCKNCFMCKDGVMCGILIKR